MDILFLELRKLGLKEKEVAVYLAGLELGASSAQNIARKAGIARPTAYEILKILEEKKLFSQTRKGKKRYFLAQSPERILSVLRLQKRELEEKEREFIRIIATLESKYASKERGGIQLFKGKEGLEILKEQILFTSAKEIMVFTSEDSAPEAKSRKALYKKIKKRLGNFTAREEQSPRLGGTLFLADKAIFISQKQQEGYLLDNPLVVETLKNLGSSLIHPILS